jgi:small-conductance mechanosensitive channel
MPGVQSYVTENFWPAVRAGGGAIVLIILAAIAYHVAVRGLGALEKRGRITGDLRFVLQRLLRWTTVILTVLVVLNWLELLQDAWTFISTVLALIAVGFVAVWSVVSNVLCSLLLLIIRPFQVGDTIELPTQSIKGKVINFTLMFTTLRGDEGELVQIPNNLFFQMPLKRRIGTSTIDLSEQLHRQENTEGDNGEAAGSEASKSA